VIFRSSYAEKLTGRSINGRSGAFEALYLGSNPSRPTKLSTARHFAGGNLGTVSRQQHAAEVGQVFGRRETPPADVPKFEGPKSLLS
jgi:hypothetical protein